MFDSIPLLPRCLALAVASILAVAGCGTRHDDQPAQQAAPADLPTIAAEVVQVQPVSWPQTVRAQGTLVADEVVIVGSKIAGRAVEVNVDLGDRVVANAALATLDQEEFQLQIVLAEAQLVQARAALGLQADDPVEKLNPQNAPPVREAKAVLDEAQQRSGRAQALRASNAVTQAELDAALGAEQVAAARLTAANNGVLEKIAQIRVRTAELQLAKQRLVDAVIQAPFEGIIQQRHFAPGAYVQVGAPIVTLVRTSILRFQGTLPERHAVRLALGQEVMLAIESLSQPRIAKITRISPVIAERSRSLMFEAALDNRDGALQTGLFAEAEVIVDPTSQVLAIPPGAIIEFAGAEKVWKIVGGVAQEQIVDTARRGDNAVEIIGGLSPGDVILYDAAQGKIARIEPTSTSVVGKPVVFVGGESDAPADVNADPSQVEEASNSSSAE